MQSCLVTAGDRDSAQCTCPLVRSCQSTGHTPRSPVCSQTWTCLFGSSGPAGAWGWDMPSNYLSCSVDCPATPWGLPSSTPPPATGDCSLSPAPLQSRAGRGGAAAAPPAATPHQRGLTHRSSVPISVCPQTDHLYVLPAPKMLRLLYVTPHSASRQLGTSYPQVFTQHLNPNPSVEHWWGDGDRQTGSTPASASSWGGC